MSDYPTWAQRKAWNNDGMDPDWRPEPSTPVAPPPRECKKCGRELFKAMKESWPRMDVPVVKEVLPEIFTNPHVTIPRDKVKMFNAQYKEMAQFAAWVCGVEVKDLCRADMIEYIAYWQKNMDESGSEK